MPNATHRRMCAALALAAAPLPTDDGYRGIWYFNQPTRDEYRYKYSGGMATYPQQHVPIAIYCAEVRKTFFVYGGTTARAPGDRQELLHMISYFDHETGRVPRPRILLNKHTDDAHDNPVLSVDAAGHLWIFSAAHGTARPAFIHRSRRPYSIDEFERVAVTNFSYPQPWYVPGDGFLFLHTRYRGAREISPAAIRCLFWSTSPDGRSWAEPRLLAAIEQGNYQISWGDGRRIATAFDYHPQPVGLNARANLYYLETRDFGRSWQTADGRTADLPLTRPDNPALVYDSRRDRRLVYLKDLAFDTDGRPVVLYLTSAGYEPGPANDPRQWWVAVWTGREWRHHPVTRSLNNYDHGSLYLEPDGTWRIIGPTEPGPQRYNPGGEMAMWVSTDRGATWRRIRELTRGSPRNHNYARRPLHAHPDFYAIWADGHGREPSESHLYFTDREGTRVWRLPPVMSGEFAEPEPMPVTP
ncbi:MAG: BNR repeat-containing protein [Kiritimatiellae bacterium]|nr:BNR repeat-containing protein [Kiritimatiellia bacterium]